MENELKTIELFLQTQNAVKVIMKGLQFLVKHYEPSTEVRDLNNLILSLEAMMSTFKGTLLDLTIKTHDLMPY